MGCSSSLVKRIKKESKLTCQTEEAPIVLKTEAINKGLITDKYDIDSELISVGFLSRIFKATTKHDKNLKYAIKIIPKNKLKRKFRNIHKEVKKLVQLDHPEIITYIESYEDEERIYIVMGY
jgi:hypothetical protein